MIPKFHKTQSSDFYNVFCIGNSMKPLKTFVRHEDLLVYSHISEDFITVEVDCDYRLSFFFIPESNLYHNTKEMVREIMEFQYECKKLQDDCK